MLERPQYNSNDTSYRAWSEKNYAIVEDVYDEHNFRPHEITITEFLLEKRTKRFIYDQSELIEYKNLLNATLSDGLDRNILDPNRTENILLASEAIAQLWRQDVYIAELDKRLARIGMVASLLPSKYKLQHNIKTVLEVNNGTADIQGFTYDGLNLKMATACTFRVDNKGEMSPYILFNPHYLDILKDDDLALDLVGTINDFWLYYVEDYNYPMRQIGRLAVNAQYDFLAHNPELKLKSKPNKIPKTEAIQQRIGISAWNRDFAHEDWVKVISEFPEGQEISRLLMDYTSDDPVSIQAFILARQIMHQLNQDEYYFDAAMPRNMRLRNAFYAAVIYGHTLINQMPQELINLN